MRVLFDDEWKGGFLPYDCDPDSVAIDVAAWITLERIRGMYFVPKKSLRLLMNYVAEIGVREVIKKVISRSKEKYRNDKFISFGLGWTQDDASALVFFLATSHPKALDQIVVHRALTTSADAIPPLIQNPQAADTLSALIQGPANDLKATGRLLHCEQSPAERCAGLEQLKGWMPYSGIPVDQLLPPDDVAGLFAGLSAGVDWSALKQVEPGDASTPDDSTQARPQAAAALPTAVLYGYGQYAKTNIIPNIEKSLDLRRVHEIDPTQIPLDRAGYAWSTSPTPDTDQAHDVSFIAGYHHTHAEIAIRALEQNKCAVVEKPVVVDQSQLDRLITAMQASGGAVYACFHKRHSVLNDFVWEDLQVKRGDPINYHCIVYEVALPSLHWYNWPNSHTRVVSNACHWIDHFLYLNDYPEVERIDGIQSQDGTANCTMLCDNGATFSMVLTDIGSPRIGLQEYIELRNQKSTVKITNSTHYVAENDERILRKTRVNKVDSYRRMYSAIGQDITKRALCDSENQVRLPHTVMIQLEDLLTEQGAAEKA